MIRIRDASGDGTVASKLVELSLKATQAQIEAPSASGQMLLELGYRTVGGDFITLEYSFLFPKRCTTWRPKGKLLVDLKSCPSAGDPGCSSVVLIQANG